MPKQKKQAQATEEVEQPQPETSDKETVRRREREDANSPRESLTIKLAEDGSIDLEAMRESTRQRLKSVLFNPKTTEAFNVKPVQRFTIETAKSFVAQYEQIKLAVGMKAFQLPPNLAVAVLSYTKDERKELAEKLKPVLDLYAPVWLEKSSPLISFLGTWLMIEFRQFQTVKVVRGMLAQGVPPNEIKLFTPEQMMAQFETEQPQAETQEETTIDVEQPNYVAPPNGNPPEHQAVSY